MKKALATGLILASASLSTQAEVSPFVGVSSHGFKISGNDVRDTSFFDKGRPTGEGGGAVGLYTGLFFNDSTRMTLQYFSGDAGGASIMSTAVVTTAIDYVFGERAHSGFFVGSGVSIINLKNRETAALPLDGKNKSSGTGLIFRTGYVYKLDAGVLLELGMNLRSAQVEHKFQGGRKVEGKNTVDGQGDFTVKDFYLSVGYAF